MTPQLSQFAASLTEGPGASQDRHAVTWWSPIRLEGPTQTAYYNLYDNVGRLVNNDAATANADTFRTTAAATASPTSGHP